jgi:hypothetical protein
MPSRKTRPIVANAPQLWPTPPHDHMAFSGAANRPVSGRGAIHRALMLDHEDAAFWLDVCGRDVHGLIKRPGGWYAVVCRMAWIIFGARCIRAR